MKSKILGLLAAALLAGPITSNATQLIIQVDDIPSNGVFGDPSNAVLTFDIGANSRVTGVRWDVSIEAFEPNDLELMRIWGGNSSVQNSLFLPAPSAAYGGTYHAVGDRDLSAAGDDFSTLADGILRLVFFQAGGSPTMNPDGYWRSGTIAFTYESMTSVPEPGTLALLGLGLAGLGLSRRRKAV